jgi:hypothetical protein
MRSFLAQRPNLPPKQSSDNQVEIGGQFGLACASGCRMGAQYEQATPRERGETPAHQFPEPSLHPVANHRRANRTADNQAYLCRVTGAYRSVSAFRQQQVPGDRGPAGSAARSQRQPEVLRPSHPGLLRQHDNLLRSLRANERGGSGVRRSAARGPCDGVRKGRPGLPGYASAAGTHGPSPADGYSAGTYACSLELQVQF